MSSNEYLNSQYTKDESNRIFGNIVHPVIGDVARMILDFESTSGFSRSDIRLWKFDLRKAFNLLTYEPDAISRLGLELSDGQFMFFLAGVFGLTGMPMAFQVVTRAILWEVRLLIRGRLIMYVDDGIGICHYSDLLFDQSTTFSFIEGLLGNKAIEHIKTVKPSKNIIQVLGGRPV
jgi:hypothetical protein